MFSNENLKLIFWGILLLLCMYYFFGGYLFERRRRTRLKNRGERVRATIIDYKEFEDPDGVTLFQPLYQFTTKDGRTIKVESIKEEATMSKNSTNTVYLYYSPENPENYFV